MTELDLEIANRNSRGFALAGRIGSARVYRGMDRVEVEGTIPNTPVAQADFNRLHEQILRLEGHRGWQGKGRKAQNFRVERSE